MHSTVSHLHRASPAFGLVLTLLQAAASYGDRVELSLARQEFDTGPAGPALGAPGVRLRQDIVGLKLRVFGEAVLDSDTLLPQVAVGMEAKNTDAGALAATLGSLGARTRGTDAYVSATKLNPSALGAGLKEDDWSDVFIAWAPNKDVSLTLAHVELGRIVPVVVTRRQHGASLSAQLAF